MEWQEITREEYMALHLEYEIRAMDEEDFDIVSHMNMTGDPPVYQVCQDKGEKSFFDMTLLLMCHMDYLDDDGNIYDGDDGKYYKFYKPMQLNQVEQAFCNRQVVSSILTVGPLRDGCNHFITG